MSVVSDEKQCSECRQKIHFNGKEVKKRSEHKERFNFNSSQKKTV